MRRVSCLGTASRMATESYYDCRTLSHIGVPDTIGATSPLTSKSGKGVRQGASGKKSATAAIKNGNDRLNYRTYCQSLSRREAEDILWGDSKTCGH